MKRNKTFQSLKYRGPYAVSQGDLTFIGVPGMVFTPQSGSGFPLVIFAHDWRTPVHRYSALFEHLASWGIVVAAPDSQNGIFVSDYDLARSLLEVEGIVTNTRLGTGETTINKYLLGFIGHGFGASAAVLAANSPQVSPRLRSLTLAWPAPTHETIYAEAGNYAQSSMVITDPHNLESATSNAGKLALSLNGKVLIKTIKKAQREDLASLTFFQKRILRLRTRISCTRIIYALITGYLLATLVPHTKYHEFTKPGVKWKNISDIPLSEIDLKNEDFLSQLLHLAL